MGCCVTEFFSNPRVPEMVRNSRMRLALNSTPGATSHWDYLKRTFTMARGVTFNNAAKEVVDLQQSLTDAPRVIEVSVDSDYTAVPRVYVFWQGLCCPQSHSLSHCLTAQRSWMFSIHWGNHYPQYLFIQCCCSFASTRT